VAIAEIDRNRSALARVRVEPVANVSFQGLGNVVDNGIFGGKPDGGVMVTVPIPISNRNQGAISRAQICLIRAAIEIERFLGSRQQSSLVTFHSGLTAHKKPPTDAGPLVVSFTPHP